MLQFCRKTSLLLAHYITVKNAWEMFIQVRTKMKCIPEFVFSHLLYMEILEPNWSGVLIVHSPLWLWTEKQNLHSTVNQYLQNF
jgi:hypothetical protein